MADAASRDSGRDPVELLLDEFLTARRRGEAVDVEAFAARAGERAGELRELIESATLLEDVKGARPRGLPLHGPRTFGDYRIVAEIGRGGMGVVYEAEQITLQRRVALKVLPPHALRSESRLHRFKREAQTAAKLHHTNIVPIFGVGEQDGVHYFVMQLIVGRPLDDVIRALRGDPRPDRPPSRARSGTLVLSASAAAEALRAGTYVERPPSGDIGPGDAAYYRSVANLGRQVADALAYAHAQGTLHRDIKPSNLILDAQGVVWVTDFGLAKVVEEDAFTGSGDLVGTLQYMAPEQLQGHADERTDVHGLGLTLYELATLRPAFAADNKGELVERVRNHEPPAPGKVRPGVPRDLETIIRKATAKAPGDRYASAAELRDDLERFLEDRPIRARPVSVLESGWRWCRRNRRLAAVGALAVFGLLSTAVASVIGYWSTRHALERANEARRLAQSNVALALQSFEDLFASVVGPDALRADDDEESDVIAPEAARQVSPEDEALLELVLGFYDKLAQANRDSAEARQLTARAYHRVAEIQRHLGKVAESIPSYERALALYEELYASGGVGAGTWMQVQNGLARALWETNTRGGRPRSEADREERGRARRRAVELAGQVVAHAPVETTPLVRFERARAHDLLGEFAWRDALRPPPAGRRGRDPNRREPAPSDREREAIAQAEERARAALAESERHYRSALALYEGLLRDDPASISYQHALARCCLNLAYVLGPRGRDPRGDAQRDETARLQRRAVDLLEGLVARDRRPVFREELIRVLRPTRSLGAPRLSGGELAQARANLQRAIEVCESLVADFPSVPRHAELLWTLSRAMAQIAHTSADHDRASEARTRALAVAEQLLRDHGETQPRYAALLATSHCEVAGALREADPEQALAHYEEAKAVADRVLGDARSDPLVQLVRSTACRARVGASGILRARGEPERARAELHAAEEILARGPQLRPGPWSSPTELADAIADGLEALGDEQHGDRARAAALRKRYAEDRRER